MKHILPVLPHVCNHNTTMTIPSTLPHNSCLLGLGSELKWRPTPPATATPTCRKYRPREKRCGRVEECGLLSSAAAVPFPPGKKWSSGSACVRRDPSEGSVRRSWWELRTTTTNTDRTTVSQKITVARNTVEGSSSGVSLQCMTSSAVLCALFRRP